MNVSHSMTTSSHQHAPGRLGFPRLNACAASSRHDAAEAVLSEIAALQPDLATARSLRDPEALLQDFDAFIRRAVHLGRTPDVQRIVLTELDRIERELRAITLSPTELD